MGGPSTRATGAMALVVAQIAHEQHFSFWPISPMTSSLRQRVGQTERVALALSRRAAIVALPSAPPLYASFLAGCPRTPVLPVSALSLSPTGCHHTYHLAERRRRSRGLSAAAAQRLPPRSSAPSPLSAVQHLVRVVRVSCLSTQILNTY